MLSELLVNAPAFRGIEQRHAAEAQVCRLRELFCHSADRRQEMEIFLSEPILNCAIRHWSMRLQVLVSLHLREVCLKKAPFCFRRAFTNALLKLAFSMIVNKLNTESFSCLPIKVDFTIKVVFVSCIRQDLLLCSQRCQIKTFSYKLYRLPRARQLMSER